MQAPFPHAMESLEPAIETARLADVPRLLEFTRKMSLAGKMSDRFPSDGSAWQSLIKSQDVVLAKDDDGNILGFYTVNQLSLTHESEELQAIRAAHNVVCNRFKLAHSTVSFGAQVLVDPACPDLQLRSLLLRGALRNVGLRYRYLFTILRKTDSHDMVLLPREGWRCFHEEDDVCYMMLDVAKTLRRLASAIVFHMPHPASVPARASTA
jgi:hypothetical protein